MERCPNIHILALLNSILCQFKPSNPSLNQKGLYLLLYHYISLTKKEKKRLSNAFSGCKKTRVSESDCSSNTNVVLQDLCCPGLLWTLLVFIPFQARWGASYTRATFYSTVLPFLHVAVLFRTSRRSIHTWSVSTGEVAQSTFTAEQTPCSKAVRAPWGHVEVKGVPCCQCLVSSPPPLTAH